MTIFLYTRLSKTTSRDLVKKRYQTRKNPITKVNKRPQKLRRRYCIEIVDIGHHSNRIRFFSPLFVWRAYRLCYLSYFFLHRWVSYCFRGNLFKRINNFYSRNEINFSQTNQLLQRRIKNNYIGYFISFLDLSVLLLFTSPDVD